MTEPPPRRIEILENDLCLPTEMAAEFRAEAFSSRPDAQCGVRLRGRNPFLTEAFARALTSVGDVWLLGVDSKSEDRARASCPAVLRRARAIGNLTLHAVPDLEDHRVFWEGLLQFCKDQGVDALEVGTFGCRPVAIPRLAPEMWRKHRREYVLNLEQPDRLSGYHANHRRNIRRAAQAKLELRLGLDLDACREHARLIGSSLARRRARGESVPREPAARDYLPFVEAGAGVLCQAVRGDQVLSSMLVLLSDQAGYYQSSGTSDAGRALGASHFLVDRAAEYLRSSGRGVFNLGGATSEEVGLGRFKAGFGPDVESLEAATFLVCAPTRRAIVRLMEWLRRATGAE